MRGCDHEKKRFTVCMPSEVKNSPFEKSCEVCKNKKTKRCDDCHHWSNFKRAKL